MSDSLVTLYFSARKDEIMALKSSKAEAGFWLARPPVAFFKSSQECELSRHLQERLSEPTETVPTPGRNEFSSPADLGIPFRKGWRAFQNEYKTLSVGSSNGAAYSLAAYNTKGEPDVQLSQDFSGDGAFDEMVVHVFKLIRADHP
jgi:hypothetical protein